MYKKRMMLQLFEDGAGAGSGGQGEMPGLETAARDLLEMHPEHMEPEHILMNSWKKLQVHEPRSLKELHWRTSSGVRA